MGEIFEYFKDLTSTDILKRLNQYKIQAMDILSNIEAKENFYQLHMGSAITRFAAMQKGTDASAIARQNLLAAQKQIELQEDYKRGYKLLNEIGHAFNGKWEYSITISSYGQMYTFHLTEEQFLQVGEWHLSSFRLIEKKSTLLEAMKKMQITGKKWDDQDALYNQSMYNNYSNAIDYAKRIVLNAHDNIAIEIAQYNSGQILEGYFGFQETSMKQDKSSYLKSISERVALARQETLHTNRYGKLYSDLQYLADSLREQTNSRGFWTGGDTAGQGQIKGENASIFEFSTIKNQLLKFIQIGNQLNFDQLELALQKAKPGTKKGLEKKINEILQEVTDQFNATVVSQGSIDKLSLKATELQSEIDSIVNSLYN